jgi:Ser/Thr protein kinase RdoA (MazF antagonist)
MVPQSLITLASRARQHWSIITGEPKLVMHRENTVFRVETSLGPAALRLHRQGYHSNAALDSELAWMAMLSKNSIKVPEPLPASNGDLLVELSDDSGTVRMADLLTWLDGTPLGRSTAPFTQTASELNSHFHSIGATMARMHDLSDAWSPPAGFTRPLWDRDGLVGDTPFWGRFWEISRLSKEEAALLHDIRHQCRRDLDDYTAQGADFGLIHADLVRENVILTENGVQFIDFDDSGFGFRMFDIATVLLKNRHEPEYENLKRSLLKGYENERELKPDDKNALELFMVLRGLTYLGWADARRDEPDMERRIRRMKDDAFALSRAYLGRD